MRRWILVAALAAACASSEATSPSETSRPDEPVRAPPSLGPPTAALARACADGPPEGIFIPSLVYSPEEIDRAIAGTAVLRGLPIHLEVPFDWEQDPFDNRVYRLGLQAWWGLAPLLHGHATKTRAEGLPLAIALAVDWLRTYEVPFEGQSEFSWNGSAVSFRAAYLAYMFLAGLCEGVLTDEDAAVLWRGMIRHGDFLLAGSQRFETNLGATHDAGLGVLSVQVPELPDAARYRDVAATRLEPLFKKLLGADDLLLEHTPWYHFVVLRDLDRARRFAPRLGPVYDRALGAGSWLITPTGNLVQFGDSHLVPPQPELVSGATLSNGLRVFGDTGYAIAREGSSYFAATAQFHSLVHKQRDELTFSWYERGRRILSDSGRYGYFPGEPGRDFALSARAHNVLTVDDADFVLDTPYGSGMRGGETIRGRFVVSASNRTLTDVVHQRWWIFAPNEWLVIVDRVEADRPRRFTRYLHLGPKLTTRDKGALIAEHGDLQVWIVDATASFGQRRVTRGQREPEVQGFTFPTDRTFVERTTIAYEQTMQSGLLVTALSLDRGIDVTAIERGAEIEIHIDGETILVTR